MSDQDCHVAGTLGNGNCRRREPVNVPGNRISSRGTVTPAKAGVQGPENDRIPNEATNFAPGFPRLRQ